MILSSTITSLSLDLGGQAQLSQDSTDGFAQLDGNTLTFNADAAQGAVAKIGIKLSGGMRTLHILKKTADNIVITYQD